MSNQPADKPAKRPPSATPTSKLARPSTSADEVVNSIGDTFEPPLPPEGYAQALAITVTIQLITLAIYLFAMSLFLRLCFYDLGYLVKVPILKWFAPLIGVIVLVCMIKPLFAMPSFRTPPVELAPELHPLIYRYVYRLCDLLNAPRPRAIWVDSEPNASAALRYGVFSIAGSNLILTIGLPLVSVLTLRQLTGVIAHELGHFNQKAGMRVPLLAYTLNGLIHRIVYERDTFDQQLDDWANGAGPIAWPLKLVRLCNWLNRGMLWLLMMINHALVSRLLRMMEFDADQYEAAIAGSKDFAVTSQTLALIGYATGKAHEKIAQAAIEKRLPDDLPLLIKNELRTLPASERKQVLAASAARQSHWHESHPSESERIEAAAEANYPGTHKLQAPATILFANYAGLCQDATKKFYSERAPAIFKKAQLVPTTSIIQQSGRDDEAAKAVERYFQGAFDIHRPILPSRSVTQPPDDLTAAVEQLKVTRGRMVTLATQAWGLNREHREHVIAAAIAKLAKEAIEKQVPIMPQAFGLVEASVRDAVRQIGDAQTAAKDIDAKLRAFENAARERLELGIRLLFDEYATAQLPRERVLADRNEVERMLAVAAALERNIPLAREISRGVAGFSVFIGVIDPANPHPALVNLVFHHRDALLDQIIKITDTLRRVEYPFEGAGTPNVGDYLVTFYPASDDLGAIASTANSLYERFGLLLQRISSRLVLIAENIETAVGLPRLADASAGEDPLAGLYQEIAADNQKKHDAEHAKQMQAALILGPEARAAAAAIFMLSLLTWFYLVRETPRESKTAPPPSALAAASPAPTPEPERETHLRRRRPSSPATPTAPITILPPPPNEPTPPAPPHRHYVQGIPTPTPAPQPPAPPVPPAQQIIVSDNRFSPNERVRFNRAGSLCDAIILHKTPTGQWRVGCVVTSSEGESKREFTDAPENLLAPFAPGDRTRADGTAVPKFLVGDKVLRTAAGGTAVCSVIRIVSRGPQPPSYIIATPGSGAGTRQLATENELRLFPP